MIYLHCLTVTRQVISFLCPTPKSPPLPLTPPFHPTDLPPPYGKHAWGYRCTLPWSCECGTASSSKLPSPGLLSFCCRGSRFKPHATVHQLLSRYFAADHLLTPTPVCWASTSRALRVSCHDQHVRRFESRRSGVLNCSLRICLLWNHKSAKMKTKWMNKDKYTLRK